MPNTAACADYFSCYCGTAGACEAVCSSSTCVSLDGNASIACQECGEDQCYGLEVGCWESGVVPRDPSVPLVCNDARSINGAGAGFNWDELPGASSQLYLTFEACACGVPPWEAGGPTFGPCASACLGSDPWGDWVCGASSPANADPTNFWTPAQGAACDACIASQCSDEANACEADGSTS